MNNNSKFTFPSIFVVIEWRDIEQQEGNKRKVIAGVDSDTKLKPPWKGNTRLYNVLWDLSDSFRKPFSFNLLYMEIEN